MKLINRFIAAALAGTMVFAFAGCGKEKSAEYPVKIAGIQFDSKPDNVVCLSDSIADILISCGYTDAIKAKSDECTQPELDNVPSVGSRNNPSYARIESIEPDAVFVDKSVSKDIIKKLGNNNYKVLNMIRAQNGKELSVLYSSISAIMEGDNEGRRSGESKASSMLQTFDAMERAIPKNEDENASQITTCYLYDINGTAATNESLCGKMFKYAKVLNVCASSETSMGAAESIRLSNPDYIFCNTGVKEQIIKSEKFADLDAIKKGNIYEISSDEFERQGDSMIENLSFIIQTIYPELRSDEESKVSETAEPSDDKKSDDKKENSKSESSKKESSKSESSKKESSKQESSKAAESSKVKADTSLKITEDTAFGLGNEDDDIKKIQKRLKELGYGDFKDGITNYYGEMTQEAFKAFQKNNGLDDDGYASPEALKLLFSDKVKRAKAQTSQTSKQESSKTSS